MKTLQFVTNLVDRRFTLLTVALAAGGNFGCSSTPDQQPTESVAVHQQPSYEAKWEQYLSDARAVPGGGYFVEWDSYLPSKEKLRAYFDEGMQAVADKAHAYQQISTGFIPSFHFPGNVDIKYCVSDSFGAGKATWVTAIANAAHAWEGVANVRFRYVSSSDSACSSATSAVDFAVVRLDGTGSYCGANKLLWGTLGCTTGKGVVEIDTLQDMTFDGGAPNVTPTGALYPFGRARS